MVSDLKKQMINDSPSQRELVDTYIGSTEFKSANTEHVYLSILNRYLKYLEETNRKHNHLSKINL